MKKRIFYVCAALAFAAPLSVSAKMLDNNLYQVCVNDIFTGREAVKKIVTQVNEDGTFAAEDLADWIEKQGVYKITAVEESGGYTKYLYEYDFQDYGDRFAESDTASAIDFMQLVSENDMIRFSNGKMELVAEVKEDGSFYTEAYAVDMSRNGWTEEAVDAE